jgi:hypothetical protein
MREFSEIMGKAYEMEDATYYRNLIQCAFMLSKPDCVLLDIFEDKGKIVMAFPKWMHKKYIQEWAERPHNNKDDSNG